MRAVHISLSESSSLINQSTLVRTFQSCLNPTVGSPSSRKTRQYYQNTDVKNLERKIGEKINPNLSNTNTSFCADASVNLRNKNDEHSLKLRCVNIPYIHTHSPPLACRTDSLKIHEIIMYTFSISAWRSPTTFTTADCLATALPQSRKWRPRHAVC